MLKVAGLDKNVKDLFGAKIIESFTVGSGISGQVYKVVIDKPPYVVAIKTAKDGALLRKESDYIKFIYSKVDIKLPNIYYVNIEENNSYMIMEYFDGMPCSHEDVLNAPEKTRLNLAAEIADNIAKLQQIKGEKYGELLNPQYANWHDYYRPFTQKMIDAAVILVEKGTLKSSILDMMKLAYSKYDEIFDEPISAPTLIHGDYWASNILADGNFHLLGVVDPFNALWADSEYEMFGLNAVYGDKLPVLEAFLSKYPVSKKFGVKNEFYILFSEVYWVTIMNHDNNAYLTEISERLTAQMKKHNIA